MKKLLESVRLSAQEFSRVQTIAVCGMLLALRLVLSLFTINASAILKISFSYLPVAAAGMLFGPLAGGAVGALGDALGSFINPTGPYFPGFTLDAFVSGFLYGLLLYRRPVKLGRTFAAKALSTLVVSIVLNPIWLSFLYGKSFFVIVSGRIAANLAMLPVDTAMLYGLLKIMEKAHIPQTVRKNN